MNAITWTEAEEPKDVREVITNIKKFRNSPKFIWN
jgi:hypothetical protein